VSAVIALVLGIASAISPRWVDTIVTFAIDLMLSIPHIVLLLLISYALGRGFWGVAIGIALTHWASLARVVRAEVMQVRGSAFIAHARKLGASSLQIAWRHVMPAVLPQFIVGLVLMFPHAILHEAAITFLGFGLPPEAPAIGVILSESMSYLSLGMWWLAVFPGLALFACVILFNAAGSALRRLADPARTQL
jgi:peptide/nickel transport system permease protein